MITEQNYYGVDWKSLPEDLTKRLKVRNYPHFDKRVSPQRVWSYISNPKNIASHGFYPFIHFSICFKKFNKNKWIRDKQKKSRWPGVKFKERNICYSAHVDRYIYQYYAFLLNQKYNEKLNFLGIDDVPVAYRTNTTDSNIEFSKRAFEFIISQENCCVMIGDFTNFFDNLNHNFLKRKLCDVLDCKTLSDDWYAVFKNITKYTKWEYDDLYKYNCDKYNSNKINKDDVFSKKKFAALETVLTKDEFKSQIKNKHLKANTVGVPQGSAISAVLANIYMIDVDKAISDYVKSLKGLYMRYSDDFIVVIPGESERFQEHYKFIRNCLEKADSVELSPEKTQIFTFEKSITGNTDKALEYGKIKNVISEFIPDLCNGNDIINFLGFRETLI